MIKEIINAALRLGLDRLLEPPRPSPAAPIPGPWDCAPGSATTMSADSWRGSKAKTTLILVGANLLLCALRGGQPFRPLWGGPPLVG